MQEEHKREKEKVQSLHFPSRADAPDIISISSVVMDAWRVLNIENEGSVSSKILFFAIANACISCSHVASQYEALVGENKPVVSESETIKHIASISARAVHGRHTGSKLTACIL